MPLYEHVFIARQDVSGAQVDQLVEAFTGVIETGDGKVVGTESWGLRNLAYRIKKNRKGHYVMMNLDAPSDAILELERQQRIHDDVLRYLTLRVEEHGESPSIMMQGRKERGSRRDDGRRARRGADGRGDTPPEAAADEGKPADEATAEAATDEGKPADETTTEAAAADEGKPADEATAEAATDEGKPADETTTEAAAADEGKPADETATEAAATDEGKPADETKSEEEKR